MYRKSDYIKLGGYEPFFKVTQDWDLFLRFVKLGKGRIIDDVLYRQYKRGDGAMANPKKFRDLLKLVALRIKLAKNTDKRGDILKKVYEEGLEAVVTEKDYNYQNVYINRLSKLVKMGDYKMFLNYRKEFELSSLSVKLKLRYYFWLYIAKLFKVSNMDKSKLLKVYSKLNYIKSKFS